MPLDELEKSIKVNKRLQNIPSATEIEKNGIALANMNKKLIEKIEELTLYVIQLKKKNNTVEKRLKKLENMNSIKYWIEIK